jgi:hypothetical protein
MRAAPAAQQLGTVLREDDVKSNGNSFGPGTAGEINGGPPSAATPLITTSRPPHADHWWYLA